MPIALQVWGNAIPAVWESCQVESRHLKTDSATIPLGGDFSAFDGVSNNSPHTSAWNRLDVTAASIAKLSDRVFLYTDVKSAA